MNIQVLGSGGFRTTPQPNCHCQVCTGARRSPQLARTGPSYYLPEFELLIDTPAESKAQIDRLGFFPKRLVFSHWHPDHTEGYRVIESFPHKVEIVLPPNSNMLEHIPALRYLERIGKCKLSAWPASKPITSGVHQVKYIVLTKSIPVFAFLMSSHGKRALICPDHAKFLLKHPVVPGLDLLIMNMGTLRQRNTEVTTLRDNLKIIEHFRPKRTILTHIEEQFHITRTAQKNFERKYVQHRLHIAQDFEKIVL